ncbi:MAG TPA: zf-TFIIB domain-containing protein [Candidatus Acidoferrum sp.]|nr:zf-TFIIB domain-containing protein [Candidatus Acidoferrum sp.]
MKCPSCAESDLVMADRQGIEIDYCAKCRGVWLDRGELDKIVERSAAEARTAVDRTRGRDDDDERDGRRGRDRDDDDDGDRRGRHGRDDGRRRRGFLDDIFGAFD